jgi:hypothetical protein
MTALRFIGEGYEVAQYQLHEAIFVGLSETVVSRFVKRWSDRGALAIDRLHGICMNRLRLTRSGAEILIANGNAEKDELFTPRKAVALKDLQHTLFINDVRVALLTCGVPLDLLLPAWALQRRLTPAPRALPDVLALRRSGSDSPGLLLLVEVDLATEGLAGVFLPKLGLLLSDARRLAGQERTDIVVLTRGRGRAAAIEASLAAAGVANRSALLPPDPGRAAISEFSHLFRTRILGS